MKKFIAKTRVIRTAIKGQKQVPVLQCNALTSIIHFVQLYNKVN